MAFCVSQEAGGDGRVADMNMDAEWRRLCGLYRERSDDELLDLWHKRDDFTETAQQAIQAVMKERGIEVEAPASAPVVERAVTETNETEVAAELNADEVVLRRFSDTMDLNRVIQLLKEEGISYRMHDHTDNESMVLGASRQLDLWLIVERRDEPQAHALLLEALGLEDTRDAESPFLGLEDFALLGYLERHEAAVVAQALGEAGVSYLWVDPKDDPEHVLGSEVGISVRGASMERAQQIAEARLAEARG